MENLDGDHIHYECIQGIRWLLEWLGYDVKTMTDEDVYKEEYKF